MARAGTDYIFNKGKQDFQCKAKDNKVGWEDVRELMFEFKKHIDKMYRSMFWHFRMGGSCIRCNYWDEVYARHLANVSPPSIQEVSDEEMLASAMEVDGSNE